MLGRIVSSQVIHVWRFSPSRRVDCGKVEAVVRNASDDLNLDFRFVILSLKEKRNYLFIWRRRRSIMRMSSFVEDVQRPLWNSSDQLDRNLIVLLLCKLFALNKVEKTIRSYVSLDRRFRIW